MSEGLYVVGELPEELVVDNKHTDHLASATAMIHMVTLGYNVLHPIIKL